MAAPTISDAIEVVSTALNELDVVYAIIGGSACRILGSYRVTEDVDLVIALTDTTPSGEDLVDALCKRKGFVAVHPFGVKTPAVRIDELEFPVEIFDSEQWAVQYPQYSRVTQDRVRYSLPSGTTSYIFPATWLLREKIHSFHQRGYPGSPKFFTDLADITFLASLIQPVEAKIGHLDFTTHSQDYLPSIKGFLARDDVPISTLASVRSLCKTELSGEIIPLVLNLATIPFWCFVYCSLLPILAIFNIFGRLRP